MKNERRDHDWGGETATKTGSQRISAFEAEPGLVTRTVVNAVADLSQTSPLDLDPLYDVVDTEALETTIRSIASGPSPGEAEITFCYQGHVVTVHSYGVVEVTRRDEG